MTELYMRDAVGLTEREAKDVADVAYRQAQVILAVEEARRQRREDRERFLLSLISRPSPPPATTERSRT